MAGSNQALNLTGMLGGISGAINGAGQTGVNYADNIRELMRPDVDMNDAASVAAGRDWAMNNGMEKQADQYARREAALGNQANNDRLIAERRAYQERQSEESRNRVDDRNANMANTFGNAIPTLPEGIQEEARGVRDAIANGGMTYQEAIEWVEDAKAGGKKADATPGWQTAILGAADYNESHGYSKGEEGYRTALEQFERNKKNDITLAGELAGSGQRGKSTVLRNDEARDQAGIGIENAISNGNIYREAIGLLEKDRLGGQASSGWFQEMFPDFRSSTIELKNLKNRLGLSVIQSTTFGALSEKELQFALDTAMPTDMNETELKAWLQRKLDAQEQIQAAMQEAALWLSSNRSKDMSDYRLERLGLIESEETKGSTRPDEETGTKKESEGDSEWQEVGGIKYRVKG